MNRKILGALLALMVLAAPLMAASPALASETVQFDGEQADSADQTNTTYIATNSDLDNVTIQMTEDQSINTDGSIVLPTNVTAADATINSSSGSGTASVTVNDGNITISETGGTSSVTVESLNVTFNVSDDPATNGSVPDAINASSGNWMENSTQLMADDDGSEVHEYLVYDPAKVVDVDYETVGSELVLNESENEIRANGSDASGQIVFHVTRNNTTYEDISLSTLKFQVAMNTTYFSDISETTSESVNRIVLEDVASADGEQTYTWSIVNPNNATNTYDVKVNATAESGEANETLVHSSIQDPDGGVESSGDTTYAHALGGGVITSPQFFNVGDLGIIGLAIGALVIAGVIYLLTRDQDSSMGMNGYAAYTSGPMMYAWVAALLVGLTMVFDYLDPFGVTFDLWTDLLSGSGLMILGDLTPIVAGVVLVVVALGLNAQNSDPTR